MDRMTRFFGTMGLAAILLIATAVPTLADSYTPVAGTSCTFNKYLIVDAGDSVPNVTFSFTIAPGNAHTPTSTGTTMAVLPGIGTPVIENVSFSNSDSTVTSAGANVDVSRPASNRSTGLTAANGVELEAGEKYATKTATVDFSSVSFKEPGIYRYVIKETPNGTHAAAGIMHDNDDDRILDVYVVDNSGALEVSAYILHLDDNDVISGTGLGAKTDGFTNEYNSKDLRFRKEVQGSQASHDKYFEFTVTTTGLNDSDVFTVSLCDDSNAATNDGNASATSGPETPGGTIAANASKTNPVTVTGAQLNAGQKFYLCHGQNIVIRGLPADAGYTVTENHEDYKQAVMTGKTNSGTIGTVASTGKIAEAGFVNTKDGIIPTGVFLYAGVGVVLVVFAVLAFALTRKNRKRFTE